MTTQNIRFLAKTANLYYKGTYLFHFGFNL